MEERGELKAYLALVAICLIWGTTYYALGIGVETIPPFIFSGIRQFLAGGILLLAMFFLGKTGGINKKLWIQNSIAGFLMITLGNGLIGWSEMYIPTGLAALIVSILPVYVVAINYFSGADRRIPNKQIITGLILGCIGVFLIFRDNVKDLFNNEYLAGMLLSFLACLTWAAGTVYIKMKPPKHHVLVNAGMQMFTGGLFLFIMSLFLDDFSKLHLIKSESVWALVYLTLIGSLFAYSCFVYALNKLPAGVVSLYAYINPFIALIMGYLLLDEPLTRITILALIATLGGTYWINKGYRKQKL